MFKNDGKDKRILQSLEKRSILTQEMTGTKNSLQYEQFNVHCTMTRL